MPRRRYMSEEDSAEVPMSPLIDAVFLLLIFFLVSTMMKRENKDIAIELPDSISAEKTTPQKEIRVIGIDAEANVYYEGREASVMQLHEALREQWVSDPTIPIRLDADQEAPVHKVIEVLELCQFNNLHDVAIRTYDENYNRQ